MRQTSRPERTRSLPIDDVERRHEYVGPKAPGDLSGVGCLQEQRNRLPEVRGGLFDRAPLTGDVELGAQRDINVAFTFEDSGVEALSLDDSRGPESSTEGSTGWVAHRLVR